MVPIARRNLLADRGRLAIRRPVPGLVLFLVLMVLGLYRGWGRVGGLFGRLPGQVWIAQAGTTDPFQSSSLLPASGGARLATIDGVGAVIPVYVRRTAAGRPGDWARVVAMGLALPAGLPMGSEERATLAPGRGRVNVDRVLAGQMGARVGSRIRVGGRGLVVAGLHGGGNRLVQIAFVDPADARAMMGTPGRVSFFLLALRPGADPAAVAAAARRAVPGIEPHTSDDFAAAFEEMVDEGFLPVVGALIGIGAVVAAAVIALTIWTATVERARDFGVLKALGAPGRLLTRVVVVQGLVVGLAGSALGAGAAMLVAPLLESRVPEFVTDLRPLDVAVVLAGAVVLAVLASLVPLQRIARIDPAMVFRA